MARHTTVKLVKVSVEQMQVDILRLTLLQEGGRVRQLATKVRLHLASGRPG